MFRCVKAGCPHSVSAKMLNGRRAECPHCQNTFIITKEHLRRVKVHCMKCQHNPLDPRPIVTVDNDAKPVEKENIKFEDLLRKSGL